LTVDVHATCELTLLLVEALTRSARTSSSPIGRPLPGAGRPAR
jgi:hypothetical protein